MPFRAVLVLYDDGCRFCAFAAERLERRGIAVAPIGSPAGSRELRDLDPAGRGAAFHAVDALGRRRSGGDAVPVVLAALPRGRLAAAVTRAAPGPTRLAYALVARNRRTLSRLLGLTARLRRASRGRAG